MTGTAVIESAAIRPGGAEYGVNLAGSGKRWNWMEPGDMDAAWMTIIGLI
jgi:hypothetical protein